MAKNRKKGASVAAAPNVAATAPLATWRVHLLAERGVRGALAAALCGLIVVGAFAVTGGGMVSLLLGGAFLWSLSDFFLPCQYTLTGSEVVARTPFSERRIAWRSLHGYAESRGGILLTPLRRRSVLDRFRGMFLHVNPEDRERVLELVKGFVARRKTGKTRALPHSDYADAR